MLASEMTYQKQANNSMNKIIFNTDFSSVSAFADEVRHAFDTSIPPIVFSIDNRESLLLFSQVFQTDKPGMGRRVSCKRATSGSAMNFTPRELYNFNEAQYPLVFSFKNMRDLEDFANGWSRLIEREQKEKQEAEEAAQKKAEEDRKRVEKERIQNELLQENRAKLDELNTKMKETQDRLALVAEKYLDGELSKEEKQQLSERYSSQIDAIRAQINELQPDEDNTVPTPKEHRVETKSAIEYENTPNPESKPDSAIAPEKKKKGFPLILKIIIGIIAFIFLANIISSVVASIQSANRERERQERIEYEQAHPSSYKKLLDALENGKVRYGMTYSEIAKIVGDADRVSRSGGVVEYAYYFRSSWVNSSDATRIQLCFNNGRLYNWND